MSLCLQEMKDIEGALFFVQRRAQPEYQLVVLNKQNHGTLLGTPTLLLEVVSRRGC